MNDKKRNIGILIILILIVLFLIGVSYAAFIYTGLGEVQNVVTTGTVTMTYTEGKEAITINNAYPMTEEVGKVLSDKNQLFDFTVSVNIVGDMTISYEVTAAKEMTSTLANNEVRLYLQKSTDGTNYNEEVLKPSSYVSISKKDEFGAEAGEMILDRGTTTKSMVNYYRLRMWVDSSYVVTSEVKNFKIKVNVYGKDGTYTEEVKNNANIVGAYTYDENLCSTGSEDTCIKTTCYEDRSANSCPVGTIVKYKVNDDEEKTFNVLDDKGEVIVLQQIENTVNNVAWDGENSDNSRGPITALTALENATSGWSNVNSQTYEMGKMIFKDSPYTDCEEYYSCSSNKYTLPSRTAKARMITVLEANSLGCNTGMNSCPKWLYSNLSNDSSYGYWTMNSYLLNAAWCVGYVGFLNGGESFIDFTGYGVRAVVEVSK